ncbi:MAG: dihydropteroate synthase [Desulfatiglandales bacterium]
MLGQKKAVEFKGHRLLLGERTLVMGVLNVTPDSFSDGGLYLRAERAIERGIQMAEEGADIIDVGGESTRPFSKRISPLEETERVIPVIEGLAKEVHIPISIDTYKSSVAREALKAGASIINDISAMRLDPEMADVALKEDVPVVLMHMKGMPEDMQIHPQYEDVISEIKGFLKERVEELLKRGIKRERIIIDPGIGFGKGFEHNLRILRDISSFFELGLPILLGTSNKSFIGKILQNEPHEREAGTLATVAYAAIKGIDIVRVHWVKKARETIEVIEAIKRGSIEEG